MWERILSAESTWKTLNQVAEENLWKEGLLIILIVALLQGLSSIASGESGHFSLFGAVYGATDYGSGPVFSYLHNFINRSVACWDG